MTGAAPSTPTVTAAAVPPPSPLADFWRDFSRNRGALAGLLFILLITFGAIFAPLVAPHAADVQYRDSFLVPPPWAGGNDWRFILGTDDVGRDIFSRIVWGAQLSLLIGVIVVTVSLGFGVLLGLIAGFMRGTVDQVIMRLMDILMALPSLLLAVAIVAVLGPSLVNAMIAIAIVVLPHYVRLTRATVITELAKDYVTASRIAGAGLWRMMIIVVLPNCLAPLIVQASLGFSSAILDAAALGFLGLGALPPTPEWGTMLADAKKFVQSGHWWVVTFPGLAILLTVLAFNLLGDGLRDALDPKLKER